MEAKIQEEIKGIEHRPEKGEEKTIDELIQEALQPVFASVEGLEAKIREETKVIKLKPEEEKKTIEEVIQEALQPVFASVEALKAKIRDETKVIDLKPEEEVSKAMDEQTLNTFLKVQEIFKELVPK